MGPSVITSSPHVHLPSTMASPMSPTFMPLYLHRSPSSSSLNTRQRSDFEQDDLAAYPAFEMPFASEPALESEQDPQLPALKKLRPNGAGEVGGTVVCAKGILTRRLIMDDAAKEGKSTVLPPLDLDYISRPSLQPAWSAFPMGTTPSEASSSATSLSSSRPMSRRSSSGASSNCGSFKAVRFACGHGLGFSSVLTASPANGSPLSRDDPFTQWEEHVAQSSYHPTNGMFEQEDGATPVSAVVYLTHSREAYDRSPIVVDEAGCKLPPREKKAGDRGWIKCGKRNGATSRKDVHESNEGINKPLLGCLKPSRSDGKMFRSPCSSAITGASPLLRHTELRQAGDSQHAPHDISYRHSTPLLSPSLSSESDHHIDTECWSATHPITPSHLVKPSKSTFLPCNLDEQDVSEEEEARHDDARIQGQEDVEPGDIDPESTPPNRPHSSALSSPLTLCPSKSLLQPSSLSLSLSPTLFDSSILGSSKSKTKAEHEEEEKEKEEEQEEEEEEEEEEETVKDKDDERKKGMDGDDDDDDNVDDDEGEVEEVEEVVEEEEDEVDEEEEADRIRRRKLGMCGLGKWSRGDVFTYDALGGF